MSEINKLTNDIFVELNLDREYDKNGILLMSKFDEKVNSLSSDTKNKFLEKEDEIKSLFQKRKEELDKFYLKMSNYNNFDEDNFKKFLNNMNKLEIYTILGSLSINTLHSSSKSNDQVLENAKESDTELIEGLFDLVNSNLELISSLHSTNSNEQSGGSKIDLYKSYYKYQKYKYKVIQWNT